VAAEETIKIICIADWGVMNEKPYDPLEKAFDSVLKSDLDIDALYISGDIAYNLDSNEGKNYEEFIRMLSQVSSRWPTIFTTGNHERISPDTVKVFNASFENYGTIDTNVTTIHFHSFNFVIYDPFGIIFGGETEDKVLAAFTAELDRVEK
jgi:metallophosphoesterase superfamily enzyme